MTTLQQHKLKLTEHKTYLLDFIKKGLSNISNDGAMINSSLYKGTSVEVLDNAMVYCLIHSDEHPNKTTEGTIQRSTNEVDNVDEIYDETKHTPLLDTLLINGMFWTLTALDAVSRISSQREQTTETGLIDILPPDIISTIKGFVMKCQDSKVDSGFRPHPHHSESVVSTLAALQILMLLRPSSNCNDAKLISEERRLSVIGFIRRSYSCVRGYYTNCPLPIVVSNDHSSIDNSFDIRPNFCALGVLTLLNVDVAAFNETLSTHPTTDKPISNRSMSENLIDLTLKCQNLDGGFGCSPGNASHAGHTFCCIGVLKLLHAESNKGFDKVKQKLKIWLYDRQTKQKSVYGGTNGQSGKDPDSCYTWWTSAVARMMAWDLSKDVYPDVNKVVEFVLGCECEGGGFCRQKTPSMITPHALECCESSTGIIPQINTTQLDVNVTENDDTSSHHIPREKNTTACNDTHSNTVTGNDTHSNTVTGNETHSNTVTGNETHSNTVTGNETHSKTVSGSYEPTSANPFSWMFGGGGMTSHRDVFHTCFALFGLLAIEDNERLNGLKINPIFAMAEDNINVKCHNMINALNPKP